MACNLVTNFEVALIKKLWQCSVLSRTPLVALLSPPPHLGGGGTATHRLTKDPCDISIGLSRIPQYSTVQYSQGFFICFVIKNPLNSLSIIFNFQYKLYFQSEQQCRQHAPYSLKARYDISQSESFLEWFK